MRRSAGGTSAEVERRFTQQFAGLQEAQGRVEAQLAEARKEARSLPLLHKQMEASVREVARLQQALEDERRHAGEHVATVAGEHEALLAQATAAQGARKGHPPAPKR